MRSLRQALKSFSGAEEVPRFLGLALVLVYVIGVVAVGVGAHRSSQAIVAQRQADVKRHALHLLATLLETAAEDDAPVQPILQGVAGAMGFDELRVYNAQGVVLSSIAPAEVGQPQPPAARTWTLASEGMEVQTLGTEPGAKQAARLPVSLVGARDRCYVEAVYALDGSTSIAEVLTAEVLLIVLASTAALFVVYRRLRQHFHSLARIGETLTQHAEDIPAQLEALRFADASDAVSDSWNSLVDLTLSLEEEVARSSASSELMAVLNNSSNGELAEAMTAVPLGIILISENKAVAYANAMSRRILGWPHDEEANLSFDAAEVGPTGQPVAEFLTEGTSRRDARRVMSRQIETNDGTFYHVQVVPVRTPQQARRFVALILDISQQVRSDKAREEFVSQVTHELRTPLTNIRAYAETLSSGIFDDPAVITECYNVITKETRRLGRLIEDILNVSQLEVGTMQLVVDNVDMKPLLTESLRDVRGLAEAKQIDLQIDLPPKLDPVRADRDKLAVVFNNLLGNAIKYTPAGGQVVLACKSGGDVMSISVRDTGIGVDPADHGRIFEKFQRAADAEVQAETGTGIGLTTAREIVQQHGGDIALVSAKGEGSTFTVTLPVEKRAAVLAEA